jgi:hypothetical protein
MLRGYRGMGGFRMGRAAPGHRLGAPLDLKGDKIIGGLNRALV